MNSEQLIKAIQMMEAKYPGLHWVAPVMGNEDFKISQHSHIEAKRIGQHIFAVIKGVSREFVTEFGAGPDKPIVLWEGEL